MLNSSIVDVSSSPSLQTAARSNIWRQTCGWNPSVFLLGGISGSTRNPFISTVISINILREGAAACFRFITSGRALHVSHFALWVCPLAIKMSEIHTFYVIRLACFDKINNLEERRSTNPQAGPNESIHLRGSDLLFTQHICLWNLSHTAQYAPDIPIKADEYGKSKVLLQPPQWTPGSK